jgi:hypothetical protein
MTEIKDSLDGLNDKIEMTEQRVNELEPDQQKSSNLNNREKKDGK